MFCFETALTFELIVTLFFWAVLFPDMTESDKSDPFEFIDHIAPIVILIIEYSFNRIPFNMKHCPVSVGILVFYGIFNMAWTFTTGIPVYDPLNFKDLMSYVWIVLLLGLEVLGYFTLTHLSRWKNSKNLVEPSKFE